MILLVGVIGGFAFSAAIGHYQYVALETKLDRVAEKLERKVDGVSSTVLNLAESVARIEGRIEGR